jgi:HK97 family phage portal protein
VGLGRLFRHEPAEQQRDMSFWALPGGYGISTTSGSYSYEGGSTEQALRNAASWCAINILADNIGRTPIDVFRGVGEDRRPVEPQPSIIANPSGLVLADVWRSQLGWSMATDGNAFGLITSWKRGMWPDSIELLDPCNVTDREVVAGVAQVKIGPNRDVHKLFPHGDIWHVPGKSVAAGSPFGLSPVKYANSSIRTSLAAEQFSSSYFDNGGLPAAIIYANSDINKSQASEIKQAFAAATANTRSPAVLGADLKLETIKVDPAESQFLDLIRFEVEQAARFWGVPPSMLYGAVSGQAVTYANITDADLNFLKHSLDGYYVRIEAA